MTEKQIENNIRMLSGQDESKVYQWLTLLRMGEEDRMAIGKRIGLDSDFSLSAIASRLSNNY